MIRLGDQAARDAEFPPGVPVRYAEYLRNEPNRSWRGRTSVCVGQTVDCSNGLSEWQPEQVLRREGTPGAFVDCMIYE
jgi:hypothetical protein